ncbi:MAG: hypothetical protein EZS28_017593, partial [Streblomastix strix]
MNNQYNIHVSEGQYDYDLSYHEYFINAIYPTVDIIAEENSSINVIGFPIYPIGKIHLSFSKFSIDFNDLFFQIDDDNSSLKFSNCNAFRNDSNTALNAYSLVVVNRGILILDNLNINRNNLKGNKPLIQSSSPKLIQFTSLNINNLSLISGNNIPLLLSATELTEESKIIISDVHVKQNTAGNQAGAENSEIVQNTLAPISETCAIQLEGLNPQQILITNSTINNRSPPNNYKQYEFKINLPSGSKSQDLINQFKDVDLGPNFTPLAVRVLPNNQFINLIMPLSDEYANIRVNDNGLESCTSYVANFRDDVQSVGCAVIIIREQDQQGLFRGVLRSVSITGSFTENDLRTDGVTVSFTGQNTLTQSNMISFIPNLPISYNPIDNALFRIRDGGFVTLTNLFIQRSNITGSENAPIVMIISEYGQYNSGLEKNAAGQIVIDNCILEGGNSPNSNVWYNLGLDETCNVGYGAAIVADGQTIVKISGSTFRTFEGPAVRALNGASISIDKNTILDNNGQRNRNTLSSMQTNVVCEGGIGTTTIDIALDNVTSFASTGNGWIFSSSDNTCDIRATFNGQSAQPRSLPQIDSANVIINISNQQTEVTINGKFLEPCMRRLILEIHETNKVDFEVIQEFGIESSSVTTNWINSENLKIQIPSSLLEDLNISSKWEISIYEYGKREQASWISTHPTEINESGFEDETEEETKEKQNKTILIISVVVPIVAIIAA